MQDKRKMAVIIVMSAIVFIITLLGQMMLGQRAQDEQNRTPAAQTQPTAATPANTADAPAPAQTEVAPGTFRWDLWEWG